MAPQLVLDVVIVGAGLGGLAAAIAIKLAGHNVRIVEQAYRLAEVGAGIQVPPNATRIIGKWGLREAFEKVSVSPFAVNLRGYSKGTLLSEQRFIPDMVEQYGTPYCNVHRADYHEILVNKCHELGVTVLLNSRVISSDLSAPSITLASGETIHADLIIGADGLNSHLRASLLGKPSPPYLTGDVAYRILISADLMRADPLLAELVKRPIMSIWMGPNSHAVCYLLKGGSLFNIVLCCPDTLPKGVDTAPAAPGELEELFASWDPRLQRLVAISHDVSKWRLQNSRAMETWVHPGKKFALMGDACHATLPYLAQGAAMAVEDGAMLGALLENIKTKAQLGDLLDLYESLRKPRTERIVLASSHQRYLNHMLDGKEQQERDRLLLEDKPKPGFPNKWKDAEFRDWMFGYNVFEEARIGWERYVSEGRFWELPEAAGSDPSREFGVVAETVKV